MALKGIKASYAFVVGEGVDISLGKVVFEFFCDFFMSFS